MAEEKFTSLGKEVTNTLDSSALVNPRPCSCRSIPQAVLRRMGARPSATNQFNEKPAISILQQLDKGSGLNNRLDRMCGRHFRALASFIGLQLQGWRGADLKPRVVQYWICRKKLCTLKEVDFPQWFSLRVRKNENLKVVGVVGKGGLIHRGMCLSTGRCVCRGLGSQRGLYYTLW